MNKYQRIVLILGAILFFLTMINAPTIQHGANGVILEGGSPIVARQGGQLAFLAEVIDFKTAITRGLGVIGTTFLLFLALKGDWKKERVDY